MSNSFSEQSTQGGTDFPGTPDAASTCFPDSDFIDSATSDDGSYVHHEANINDDTGLSLSLDSSLAFKTLTFSIAIGQYSANCTKGFICIC